MDLDVETTGTGHTEIQTRGLPLGGPLRQAVAVRAGEYRRQFPGLAAAISVRIFAIAGAAPGLDRGCLVCATRTVGGDPLVASEISGDPARAVHGAFGKLETQTRALLARRRAGLVTVRQGASGQPLGISAGA
jgi:hypothetical protein